MTAILILTADDDLHADYVVARLHERRQAVIRIDPADIVSSAGVYDFELSQQGLRFNCCSRNGERLDAECRIRSVLVRRPSRPTVHPQIDTDTTGDFFLGEAVAVTEAIPYLIDPNALWVNHPRANREAGFKLRQLALAHRAGLLVPQTIVTNVPAKAFRFYKGLREAVVCKPLSSTPITQDGSRFIFTHELPPAMSLADFDDVALGSSLLQRRVSKRSDVRVAVIGDNVLGCEILSQQDVRSRTDWRVVPVGLQHRPLTVPTDVADELRVLRRLLGLSAMHCDFAVDDADGRWWFLEANPNGQWLWVELATGAAIADALADLLVSAASS